MSRRAPLLPMFLISTPLLFTAWLLFASTFSIPEVVAGAAAALFGAAAIGTVERDEHLPFRPRWKDWLQIVFVPWLLVQGSYEIVVVSLRDLLHVEKAESAFQVARFEAGGLGSAVDAARRVLAITYTTMAPNFIVLGINTPTHEMLFHQIHTTGVPGMTRNLGATP